MIDAKRTAGRWGRLTVAGAVFAIAAGVAQADPILAEFMASNKTTLADEDGDFSDWIELYNPDANPVDLAGWCLTDNAKKKNKWKLPAVTLAPNARLIVFASGKDRSDPARPLHTNFSLDADGEYLGLIRPDEATAVTEFAPTFPAQLADVSYGITQPTDGAAPLTGFLLRATPGDANGPETILPSIVTLSHAAGPFTEAFTLELSGAAEGEKIRYVLADPSVAAVPEPTATSPSYSGPITVGTSVVIRAAVFSADDRSHGQTVTAQFTRLAPEAGALSSPLPVVMLDTHGSGWLYKDDVDHPAWFYLFTPGADGRTLLNTPPALATPATVSVRGNFTATFPKQNYNITLQTDLGRDGPRALLDLDESADWAIVGPWATDRSYIRNAYVYTLSNRIGRWAPRTRFVETFVNRDADGVTSADYVGLGILTDRIKIGRDRVDIASLSASDVTAPAITGGYVLKFDPVPDPTHYNFITDHGIPAPEIDTTALVVEIPKADKLNQPQRDYIRGYVQQMENALFDAQAGNYANRAYLDYLDLPSWIDHHLLEVFFGNVDALFHSDYFYKDRGGKLVAGPAWDFDGTMDSGDWRNVNWNTWDTTGGRDLWNYGWWGPLLHDPEARQNWIERWQELRRTEFSAERLTGLADELAAQVTPEAAARDQARWPENLGRFDGGYLGEVEHLKDWISHRAIWIDQQFVAAPALVNAGENLTFTAPEGATLAYTLDGSDPRALGGAVAPNAIIAAGPITVPATANVHVRSYRADLKDAYPGTPWSSAVASAASTPISPRATFINLSSRAIAGADEDTLIAGVTVADSAGKGYLARAVGPTLSEFGIGDFLRDPVLKIFRADGVETHRNTGWQTGPDAARLPDLATSVGAFALSPGNADSALVASVPAGGHTLHLTSAGNQNGVALIELYTLDDSGRTLNLSTRARVGTGTRLLVSGFVVKGPAYKRMLIRAVGPTLKRFDLNNALADPVFNIYSGQTVVATNDDWSLSAADAVVVAAAAKSVGAFDLPDGSKDAALLVTLPPGAYTVEVHSKDATEGIALLELYEVP